jgi:hypothetical protein
MIQKSRNAEMPHSSPTGAVSRNVLHKWHSAVLPAALFHFTVEKAIRATLAKGTGMLKAAKLHGVSSGTVQRISRDLPRQVATGTGEQLFGAK